MAIQIALRFAICVMGDGESTQLGIEFEYAPIELEMPHGSKCWLSELGVKPSNIADDVVLQGAKVKSAAVTEHGLALEFDQPWRGERMITGTFLF